MVVGDDGKLLCCYINNLEFINNVMKFVKEIFLK